MKGRGFQDDTQVSTGADGLKVGPHFLRCETQRRNMFVEEEKELVLDPLSLRYLQDIYLEMLSRHLDMILEFKRDLWARDVDLRVISLKLVLESREMDDITQGEI